MCGNIENTTSFRERIRAVTTFTCIPTRYCVEQFSGPTSLLLCPATNSHQKCCFLT